VKGFIWFRCASKRRSAIKRLAVLAVMVAVELATPTRAQKSATATG
jgi:hypothetical protein